jgi:chromosomal replication initiator protein
MNIKTMYGTTDQIIEKISNAFGVTLEQTKGKCRNDENVNARHASMYFFRFYCKLPLRVIADIFQHKCHSSVMYGTQRVKNNQADLTYNYYFKLAIESLIADSKDNVAY